MEVTDDSKDQWEVRKSDGTIGGELILSILALVQSFTYTHSVAPSNILALYVRSEYSARAVNACT